MRRNRGVLVVLFGVAVAGCNHVGNQEVAKQNPPSDWGDLVMIDDAAGDSYCLPQGILVREITKRSAWTNGCPVILGNVSPVQGSACKTTYLNTGDRIKVGEEGVDKRLFVQIKRDNIPGFVLDAHGADVTMSPYLGGMDEKHVHWLKARDNSKQHTVYVRILDTGLGTKPFEKYYLVTDFFDGDGDACNKERLDEERPRLWTGGSCGRYFPRRTEGEKIVLPEGSVGTGGEHRPDSSGQCKY